jgi:hypothetical protein
MPSSERSLSSGTFSGPGEGAVPGAGWGEDLSKSRCRPRCKPVSVVCESSLWRRLHRPPETDFGLPETKAPKTASARYSLSKLIMQTDPPATARTQPLFNGRKNGDRINQSRRRLPPCFTRLETGHIRSAAGH